jgi:putative intracellular protease/amidase
LSHAVPLWRSASKDLPEPSTDVPHFILCLSGLLLLAACNAADPHLRAKGSAPPMARPDSIEHAATLAAMRPPRARQPVVAVLGHHGGAETTDFLVPYAVLRQSGLADVWALSTRPGPLRLHPALTVEPDATLEEFDAQHPEGADYIIVPALHRERDPVVLAWVRAQHARGAVIVGVCSGVKVLSHAGLLAGRKATGHWYDLAGLRRRNPTMRWVPDRRYVADRGVVTTTGVSASVPISLAMVEAIGGREIAAALARELGAERWDAAHASSEFRLRAADTWTVVSNTVAVWRRETVGIPVEPGVDLVSLSLTADAYSRTYRSRAVTVAALPDPVESRQGLRVVPDAGGPPAVLLPAPRAEAPVQALEEALAGIERRYGRGTADWVALQLEYLPTHRAARSGARP